eukprot:c26295_g1_i1.p1 GENE.c26295_g1_i1~~c26295_g1_i1.p1  ORF type:complete len:279 (+),score=44.19 c26295_g1_i1:246-1082(+)
MICTQSLSTHEPNWWCWDDTSGVDPHSQINHLACLLTELQAADTCTPPTHSASPTTLHLHHYSTSVSDPNLAGRVLRAYGNATQATNTKSQPPTDSLSTLECALALRTAIGENTTHTDDEPILRELIKSAFALRRPEIKPAQKSRKRCNDLTDGNNHSSDPSDVACSYSITQKCLIVELPQEFTGSELQRKAFERPSHEGCREAESDEKAISFEFMVVGLVLHTELVRCLQNNGEPLAVYCQSHVTTGRIESLRIDFANVVSWLPPPQFTVRLVHEPY